MEDRSLNAESNLLTRAEVAAKYRVSTRTVDNWVKSKYLRSHKVGPKQIRFKREELPIFSKND